MAGKGLTGVTASDNSIALFTDFKKSSNRLRFAIFYIVDGKIEVENSSEGKEFDEFTNLLPSDDCRYALYKNNYITNDGRDGEKIVSVLWSPDTAKVKSKMHYAGSKSAVDHLFNGIMVRITATDFSELTPKILSDACTKV